MEDFTADDRFMRAALEQANQAATEGEVPVGAVVVVEDRIVGRGRNRREATQNPLAHAELEALREAAQSLGSWRIGGTLYCTLEPCPMCAGALVQARVERLVFGADDPKGGAVGSLINVLQPNLFNHTVAVTRGVLREECAQILSAFFARRR